ncbi:MAG: sigma-70 family RNA polymerase sigma factor [Ruminococcus sp.]|nr:sigma-70 family RNA polymerase sigma factor [Ruminococcus sp.]MBR6581893.1 sigma-70 family RNA polymerase sigma factor [Ruminococcus sp.]
MEDQQIIDLYFDRNEQAITETNVKYGKLCHSIAYNILSNREDSEECVNDTYIGVWNAIPPTRPDNLMAFVCRIARNLSLKRLEYLKREKRSADVILSLDELSAVLPDERYAPDVSDEDVGRLISQFLRTQKEDVRNVFIRKYYFFDSVKEIAERYSFTESKVKNMLFYTRNKLKDYLIKEGVEI